MKNVTITLAPAHCAIIKGLLIHKPVAGIYIV